MTGNAQLVVDARCELGEGPLWANGTLYWFDILGQALHSLRPSPNTDSQQHSFHSLPEMFSAAACTTQDNVLLLASASALWLYDLTSQDLQWHARVSDTSASGVATRTNDSRADRNGGFWFSTMGLEAQFEAGSVHRYYQGEVRTLRSNLTIPNAICFNPEGTRAFFADTHLNTIFTWALDASGWPVGQPQTFIGPIEGLGYPDGAVVDCEGGLWNARWSAGEVVRFTPDAKIESRIQIPVSCPTCPSFGGDDLKTLYVTTAWEGFDSERRAQEPHAGGLYAHTLTVAGLADGHVDIV